MRCWSARAPWLATRPRRCAAAVVAALSFTAASEAAVQEAGGPGGLTQDEAAEARDRAAAERRGGRAAEAEYVLREALARRRDPALLLDLAAVLVERADALDATSDLGQSLRVGVLEEALACYEEAARSAGFEADGAIGAASCHDQLGRAEEAQRTLEAALARLREPGGQAEARRRLVAEIVRHLADLGREEEARSAIAAAQSAGDLDAAGARVEELRIAWRFGRHGGALPLAEAALEAGADSFEVAYLCWETVGSGRLEALLNVYSKLLERRSGDLALRFYRGATRRRLGDGPGAASDLERCVDAPGLGLRARLELGEAQLAAKRAEEALAHFERVAAEAEDLLPEALNGFLDVAVQRARERRFTEALDLFQRVLARDPTNLWARMGEPLCWKSLGDYRRAAEAYEEGLEALPEEPRLLNDHALLLGALGERDRAKELFERALGAAGESEEQQKAAADGGENLGIIAYRDERDLGAAARYFARAILLDPDRPRVRFYRELCLCDAAR
jgi:tetratricopeptide (TPR) repeat protein